MSIEELRNVRLFSQLGDEALTDLNARLKLYRYRKGNVVMHEGDVGHSMYVIRSGQVQIVSKIQRSARPDGVITNFGPGEPIGELALLLGRRRSATVRVVLDAELWQLRKADLDELLIKYPSLGIAFSRELAIRLIDTHEAPPKQKPINLIGAIGEGIPHLAWHLQRITGERIMLLDLGGMEQMEAKAPSQITVEYLNIDKNPELLSSRLSEVVDQYQRVLIALPNKLNPLTRQIVKQAEIVIKLGGRSTLWINRSMPNGSYWYYADANISIPRIARRIARKRIGLALSSGNARCLAHLGVLHVLEQAGIPIDMLVGTNCGALFGGLYAIGKSLDEIIAFGKELATLYNWQRVAAMNILPGMGFVRDRRVQRVFEKAFGDATFEDTRIPFSALATDMNTGEEVILNSGRLVNAMRATMASIPLFEPVELNGQWLIDGASLNPMPVNLLADYTELLMGSSVIVPLHERIRRQVKTQNSRAPNLMGLFFTKEAIMEAGIVQHGLGEVDVLIEPDVALFDSFDFERGEELIEVGACTAEAMLPTIKKMIDSEFQKRLTG